MALRKGVSRAHCGMDRRTLGFATDLNFEKKSFKRKGWYVIGLTLPYNLETL
jgi:hypothetical protein